MNALSSGVDQRELSVAERAHGSGVETCRVQ
jgi:hypothetical protein